MEDPAAKVAEPELAALTAVVQALKAIPRDAHTRVIDAALVLLGGSPQGARSRPAKEVDPGGGASPDLPTDIRQLKDLKQPASASEMAALVAFYLSEVAQPAERKEQVDMSDMVKYFKQARFSLPANLSMTLVRAKNAGYFDATGGGQYRLNPVGYNLIAHHLPRGEGESKVAGRSKGAKRGKRRRG